MEAIRKAISIAGGASHLAACLGVSTQAVCFWRDGARSIPPERCIAIEKVTGGEVRCEHLRPDVDWAYLRGTAAVNGAPEPTPAAAQAEQGV